VAPSRTDSHTPVNSVRADVILCGVGNAGVPASPLPDSRVMRAFGAWRNLGVTGSGPITAGANPAQPGRRAWVPDCTPAGREGAARLLLKGRNRRPPLGGGGVAGNPKEEKLCKQN